MTDNRSLDDMFSEFLSIYKLITTPQIVTILNAELSDSSGLKKRVYELSDGNRSTRDIKDLVGVSHITVRNYWQQWALKGLMKPTARQGRYAASFDLKQYGLSELNESGEAE